MAPHYLPKPGAPSIRGNTTAQCCDAQTCTLRLGPDPGAACGARNAPRDGYDTLQGGSIQDCCAPKTCPQLLPNSTCTHPLVPHPQFPSLVPGEGEEVEEACCLDPASQEQRYPFPYCRCHGAYSASDAAAGHPASGDGDVALDNLRFRLSPHVVQVNPGIVDTEFCFHLEYYGAIPLPDAPAGATNSTAVHTTHTNTTATNATLTNTTTANTTTTNTTTTNTTNTTNTAANTIGQWCAAQQGVDRIEFMSKPECTPSLVRAVFYPHNSSHAINLATRDTPMCAPDPAAPPNTTATHPDTGEALTLPHASIKAINLGASLAKHGVSLASLPHPATLNASFVPAGRVCLRLSLHSPCATLNDLCGGHHYAFNTTRPGTGAAGGGGGGGGGAPPPPPVRCQWALMEGSDQRCCPTQTHLVLQ